MKMLVTGFTPFGGEQINPSWEAARRLPNRIGGAELIKHEIPTEFDASGAALHKLLTELRPDAVLCVGQYGGANCIRVERVAINLRDARIADNAGKQPTDEPVVPGGPDAYFATIPTREIVDALREQNIPAPALVLRGYVRVQQSPLLRPARERAELSRPALRLCPRPLPARAGKGRQCAERELGADGQSTGNRGESDRGGGATLRRVCSPLNERSVQMLR